MKVPFFDLRVNNKNFKKKFLNRAEKIFSSGKILLGPEVDEFELKVAKFVQKKKAIGVSSGSSAIYLALKGSGIEEGDEVITSPLSWIISANAILSCGAKPVFVDVDDDYNISTSKIENAISKKTKAILPVHFFGKPCKMDIINSIAKKNKLIIVEDAAQGFGSLYQNKSVGHYSKAVSFSMNAMKNLSALGEAGAVATNNFTVYKKIKQYRYAGTFSDPKKIITNKCSHPELNHKIDTLQAAFLIEKLKFIKEFNLHRYNIAKFYNEQLREYVVCPDIFENKKGFRHALYSYCIRTKSYKRDKLMKYLNDNNIQTKIYHKPLISNTAAYRKYSTNKLVNANKFVKEILSLPCNEKITYNQAEYVVSKIKNFFKYVY